ncbi:MAG: discoidin domain-containing protein [Chloroflexota bacterium]
MQPFLHRLCFYCSILLLLFLFLTTGENAAQATPSSSWNPDAGLAVSWTKTAVLSATSTGTNLADAIDGDPNTSWQSGACLPTGYRARADLNSLLNACDSGLCASSSSDPEEAVDASVYTAATVPVDVSGEAWLEVTLPTAQSLTAIGLRFITTADLELTAVFATDSQSLATFTPADNYSDLRLDAPAQAVHKLRLSSSTSFTLTEFSVLAEPCFEAVTFDLGEVREIGWLVTRHWAGGQATETVLQLSNDNQSWTDVGTVDPDSLSFTTTVLEPTQTARYIRVRHEMLPNDWAKTYVWEVDAYDANGKYGPAPTAVLNPHSFADLLGVNGIWGWGHNAYSDSLAAGEGPTLFNQWASHARNYHNLRWDITDPDHTPDYETMAAGGGTEAHWWLNWDREYGAWTGADLELDASFQFSGVDEADWDTPYQSAYDIGYAFASHFGPTHGTGHLTTLEVGNEPWDYSPALYRDILLGMSSGAKAADPNLQIMPGAFQADTLDPPTASGGNYLGTRLTEATAAHVDILNAHHYSYIHEAGGTRTAVYPEHPLSSFHAIRNMIRFRDHNMPGKPIYLTEWGWDSDGGGEDCAFSECVSEQAQALYAIRGALLMARNGIDRLTWFFYANSQNCATLYCRSGVVASSDTDFAPKRSFTAFKAFVQTLGDRHFVGVLREDEIAWIYLLGDADGTPTHLVAWRPINGDDATSTSVSLTLDAVPAAAWELAGLSDTGETAVLPAYDSATDEWIVEITAVPLIVAFATAPAAPAVTAQFHEGEVTLAWPQIAQDTNQNNTTVSAYTIYHSPTPYFTPATAQAMLTSPFATPVSFAYEIEDEQRYWLITAVNAIGESYPSNQIGQFSFPIYTANP